MPPDRTVNELVLSDGEYAFTQDTTKGVINVHTGPTLVNIGGQEYPVVYDDTTRRFVRVELDKAAQICPLAPQGSYCVLRNPAKDGAHPNERSKQTGPELSVGQMVNIPGPTTFALWPRQVAQVIPGHILCSNEYLLVRVYDEEAAKKNWGTAVVKPATSSGDGEVATPARTNQAPKDLTVGRLLLIKGTEVSFYIPPTGIEVVAEEGRRYVRNALTLERLEYCILIGENGSKRYERGPQVVFPEPTERFFVDEEGNRAFRPVDLSPIQGIHIRVIADYEENEKKHKEGEELFITGKDTPIYFPRPEHSIVSYDGRSKHFAVAIPAGEARYVMDRISGKITTVKGPAMLLPDPRREVIVRRILSDAQCSRWYPGNAAVLEYNRGLQAVAEVTPTSRPGVVLAENAAVKGLRSAVRSASNSVQTGGDVFAQGTTYTQPRTVTLDTKLQGVPTIDIWTGYAVLIVSRSGERRVEVGPKTVLLDYDEALEVLELSTGKPKNTDTLLKTVYLRVKNNQVSDIIGAETADHVNVEIKLSLRVSFDGDVKKWFEVENYVKFLCDHVRSVLRGSIRKIKIDDFYARSEDIIRDIILGTKDKDESKRPGMSFSENGMQVYDVEILKVTIPDAKIAAMLAEAQVATVQENIALARARRELETTRQTEDISRAGLAIQEETAKVLAEVRKNKIQRDMSVTMADIDARMGELAKRLEETKKAEEVTKAKFDADILRKKLAANTDMEIANAVQSARLAALKAETDSTVARFEAGSKGLSEALVTLRSQQTVVDLAEALSVQTMVGGGNFTEVVEKVLGNPALAKMISAIAAQAGR